MPRKDDSCSLEVYRRVMKCIENKPFDVVSPASVVELRIEEVGAMYFV
jgi:hypothetical protein